MLRAIDAVLHRSDVVEAPSTLRCFMVLVLVKLALITLGFGRTHRLVRRLVSGREERLYGFHPVVNTTALRVAQAAAVFPGRALCLEQSMTLYLLLRRMGVEAALRLGVQAYPFAAHAWVEHGGEAVNEDPESLQAFAKFSSQEVG